MIQPKLRRELEEREATADRGYVVERRGLRFLRELTHREWLALGPELQERQRASEWGLIDWLLEGGRTDRNWLGGSTYAKACQILGYSVSHVNNLYRVGVAYRHHDARYPSLSISCHKESLRVPEGLIRTQLMSQAAKERWSAERMTEHINELIRQRQVPSAPGRVVVKTPSSHYYQSPQVECPKCHHRFSIKGHKVAGAPGSHVAVKR